MSIATGFIYTILICFACIALWRALKMESEYKTRLSSDTWQEESRRNKKFKVGVLDPFFTDPFKLLHKTWRRSGKLLAKFLFNIIATPYTVAMSMVHIKNGNNRDFMRYFLPLAMFFTLFVALHLLQNYSDGTFVFAWIFYLCKLMNMNINIFDFNILVFCGGVSIARGQFRSVVQIDGHPIEDIFFSFFFFPSVAVQMEQECQDTVISEDLSLNNPVFSI